jgi:UDP-N-acetylglucosamine--N-acetylmuramyl-(pentapeptide) pyrophosphoryl-undecaprenol N-acetylglucosamine transferase
MMKSVQATIANIQVFGGPRVLKLIDEVEPDVIVSDSYYLGTLAGKAKGMPVYIMVNQTRMIEFFQDRGVPMKILGELAQGFYMTVFENVDRIIIPDYPPPYTVCRRNLRFTKDMVERVVYSGPLIRRRYGDAKAKKLRKPHVLSMIGGFGYRKRIFDNVLAAARLDKKIYYTLVSGPSVKPEDIADAPPNAKVVPFIPDPFPYIKGCDLVIAPGGHSSSIEAMSYGKPLLSVPDMLHSEQENNATVINEEGLGRRLSHHTPPKVILECIKEVLGDKNYGKRTARLRKLTKELNGPKNIRLMLEAEVG